MKNQSNNFYIDDPQTWDEYLRLFIVFNNIEDLQNAINLAIKLEKLEVANLLEFYISIDYNLRERLDLLWVDYKEQDDDIFDYDDENNEPSTLVIYDNKAQRQFKKLTEKIFEVLTKTGNNQELHSINFLILREKAMKINASIRYTDKDKLEQETNEFIIEFFRGLKLSKDLKDSIMINYCLFNIGCGFSFLEQKVNSIKYYSQTLPFFRKYSELYPDKYIPELVKTYFNLAIQYMGLKKNKFANFYFEHSLKLQKDKSQYFTHFECPYPIGETLLYYSKSEIELHNYNNALSLYKSALDYWQEMKIKFQKHDFNDLILISIQGIINVLEYLDYVTEIKKYKQIYKDLDEKYNPDPGF